MCSERGLLRTPALLLLLAFGQAVAGAAQTYFPDDPLVSEPPPLPVVDPRYRALNELVEFIQAQFGTQGQRHAELGLYFARGVNTLGEVMDGPWFNDRHARERLTPEALARGPGGGPPRLEAPLQVFTVKRYGVRPGMLVRDVAGDVYLLRFDHRGHPELATGAEIVSNRILHAIGYWVPETYLVRLEREQLVPVPEGADVSSFGAIRRLVDEDIDRFLDEVEGSRERGWRAIAIRVPEGTLLGAFSFYGTRSDDPNDYVPHEHRRELRGLKVISSWLANDWIQSVNSVDVLVEQHGVPHIRHYLVDFMRTLGAGDEGPKHAREGFESLFGLGPSLKNLAGLGVYAPAWQRAHYPPLRGVGRFECELFAPLAWVPNHELAPFSNALPDDDFWAARKVMSFTDSDLEAIVAAAQYSDPEAARWIASCLAERRDRIGRAYFARVLPLTSFRVEDGELRFDDLEVERGWSEPREYTIRFGLFDSQRDAAIPLTDVGQGARVPPRLLALEAGAYAAVRVYLEEPEQDVVAVFRRTPEGFDWVGVDYGWPGKSEATAVELPADLVRSYADLEPRKQRVFDPYAEAYNRQTGTDYTPAEFYSTLDLSQRTTFDAVVHALEMTELSDQDGAPLGTALELVRSVDRIAGEYVGRGGDEQFRLYVELQPGVRETLDASTQFKRGKDNTVYHIGYPYSYRQQGKYPSIQFSVSEDGLRADIDVDYRSSKMPAAMFNGHLTAANSDIRAGDNHQRHTKRWSGLINWWQELLGKRREAREEPRDLMGSTPPEDQPELPADRPRKAGVSEIHEAVEELFADWLLRKDHDAAMEFFHRVSMACLNDDEDAEVELLSPQAARRELRELLEYASDEFGTVVNLSEVLEPVLPWRAEYAVVEHPYSSLFALIQLTSEQLLDVACTNWQHYARGDGEVPELSYASLVRFETASGGGGILGLVWVRDGEAWRVVAWRTFRS